MNDDLWEDMNAMKRLATLKKVINVGILVLSLAFVECAFAKNKGAAYIDLPSGELGVVDFPHKLHQRKLRDCEVCHRLYPEELGAIEKSIGARTLKRKQVMGECIDCHRQTAIAGKKSGTTSCRGCHPM